MTAESNSARLAGLVRSQPYAPPADRRLEIVYEDVHLLAINKPPGLLSVPGRGPDLQDCALARVQNYFPHALLVHRLDEATSGLMMFGQSPFAQRALSRSFEARQVRKSYLAWVHGLGLPQEGVIDAAMVVDWPKRPLRKIDSINGKGARTRFETLQKNEHSAQTLCRLEPETGRTHQLRLHMQHLGHPIVGDRLYGQQGDRASRLMLHAHALAFLHPASGTPMKLLAHSPF